MSTYHTHVHNIAQSTEILTLKSSLNFIQVHMYIHKTCMLHVHDMHLCTCLQHVGHATCSPKLSSINRRWCIRTLSYATHEESNRDIFTNSLFTAIVRPRRHWTKVMSLNQTSFRKWYHSSLESHRWGQSSHTESVLITDSKSGEPGTETRRG